MNSPFFPVNASPAEITAKLKADAHELGFALAGVCPAVSPLGLTRLDRWLEQGYDGEMHYLQNRRDAYSSPGSVLEGARSILMLAMPYRTSEPASPQIGRGRISRYAWGPADYHDVIHQRMRSLIERWRDYAPEAKLRGVVDTAPLLEREFAQLAGLGWIGKNTMLLNKWQGSWFFLAAVLTDQQLEYDQPHETDHCGTCRACLDACPTRAFPEPYVLDATRCISYLTIELRGPIPNDLRIGMQDWLFGCDICQEVCPWNSKAPPNDECHFAPADENHPIELYPLFELDDASFRERFKHTALWRPRRRGILRNAAIVLGNQRDQDAVSSLRRGLHDQDSIVRATCAWALGQIATADAIAVLTSAVENESDPEILAEIRSALKQIELEL